MTKEEKIIEIYETAIKDYANPDSWLRGIVYTKRHLGNTTSYGFDLAAKALKDVEALMLSEEV